MLNFIKRNERKISFAAFVAGFVFDWLTVKYMELEEAGLVLGGYLISIAVLSFIQNYVLARNIDGKIAKNLARYAPFIIQFMFGTLFNAAFIFYSESAELYSSWPFLLFLIFIVISNELLRKRISALDLQLSMLLIATILYFIFATPIVIKRIDSFAFILANFLSLLFIILLMFALRKWAKERFFEKHIILMFNTIIIFAGINFVYFKNIIPPIPLVLKNAGLYHSVTKIGNDYKVLYEPSRNKFWSKEDRVFRTTSRETAYIFTSVFAPSKINLSIYHEWRRYDFKSQKWILVNKIGYNMVGGRKDGYRGYTFMRNISPGKWRVYVTDERGRRLGRISFEVRHTESLPVLEVKTI